MYSIHDSLMKQSSFIEYIHIGIITVPIWQRILNKDYLAY